MSSEGVTQVYFWICGTSTHRRRGVRASGLVCNCSSGSLVQALTCSADSFNVSQVYAIIVLPNGGPDLETYTFDNAGKTGWKQACSIFWQVTKTLAQAEELVSFEVRAPRRATLLAHHIAIASRFAFGSDLGQEFATRQPERSQYEDACVAVYGPPFTWNQDNSDRFRLIADECRRRCTGCEGTLDTIR